MMYRLVVYLQMHSVSVDTGEQARGEFNSDQEAIDSFRQKAATFRSRWGHRYNLIDFTVYQGKREVAKV